MKRFITLLVVAFSFCFCFMLGAVNAQSMDPCFYYGMASPECLNGQNVYYFDDPYASYYGAGGPQCPADHYYDPVACKCMYKWSASNMLSTAFVGFLVGLTAPEAAWVIFTMWGIGAVADAFGVTEDRAARYKECLEYEMDHDIPLSQTTCRL